MTVLPSCHHLPHCLMLGFWQMFLLNIIVLICCLFFFFQMYENFVEEVDAVDNGISQYDGEARYTVSTTLSTRVSHLNPWWNSDCQDTEVSKENPFFCSLC